MKRLILPAYAKQLLADRRAGRHPLEVTLIYGNDWQAGDAPRLALKPEDYEPGKFDFHMIAGEKITVLDQVRGAYEFTQATPPSFGKFYDLLRELAACDAYVVVDWPMNELHLDAEMLAYGWRWFDPVEQRMRWPLWWSDVLSAKHRRRVALWWQDRAVECGVIKHSDRVQIAA